ncbi:cell division protein FtsQ/DivIB [Nocardiopsis sediminis]|uniref:Cell division protein FtsQ/DivIB n=1 Tax=Nocardiopsis sediminis TaxID=1778267 RepID=A0ABV8FU40_9ACTN
MGTTEDDTAAPPAGTHPETGAAVRRRSDPWKAAFVILLIVALLAVVTWVLLGSRLLVVREVEVTGADRLAESDIVDAVAVPTGTPLARVDTDRAAADVRGLRLVEHAEVTRGWPATLRVAVTERTPRLSVRVGDGYRLVDHDGVRITDSDTRPEEYPLISVKGEVEGNAAIAAAAEITDVLPEEILSEVDEIRADDPARITLDLRDGAAIVWGDAERAGQKRDILRILMAEHPPGEGREYDVSAPEMAVVR